MSRTKQKPARVGCTHCRWRGRRVLGDCACYDEWAMHCRCAWGSCPKCGARVETMNTLKPLRQAIRKTYGRSLEEWIGL